MPVDVLSGSCEALTTPQQTCRFLRTPKGGAEPCYVVACSGEDMRDVSARYVFANAIAKSRYRPIQASGLSPRWFSAALGTLSNTSYPPLSGETEERNSREDKALQATAFLDVKLGMEATVGQCRPLSKTVRFNVIKVEEQQNVYGNVKKQFRMF